MSQQLSGSDNHLRKLSNLSASWRTQQVKVYRLMEHEDSELHIRLQKALEIFALNVAKDLELNNASKTFLGRIGDVISFNSGPLESQLSVAKKSLKLLSQLGEGWKISDRFVDQLKSAECSRYADIHRGVSLLPGVMDREEWVKQRIDCVNPYEADPGCVFDINYEAIDSAVKSYLKGIEKGSQEMPDYRCLSQQMQIAKLEGKVMKISSATSSAGDHKTAEGGPSATEFGL